jgi:hypothetical protein
VTLRALATTFVVAGTVAAVAAAAAVDVASFRYTRTLSATSTGTILFEPDSALLGHAKVGLGDLRVVDANGGQVPWRHLPGHASGLLHVPALNSGTQGPAAVALFDLGPGHAVHDRLTLDIPEMGFIVRITVSGSDRREGAFTRLGTTTIYDVAGARHARSTVVLFSPTDFRYLRVRGHGIRSIRGATVQGGPSRVDFVARTARTRVSTDGRRTVVVLDLGYPHVPASELRIGSATPKYDRAVEVAVSEIGRDFTPVAYGRIVAFPGSTQGPIDARLRARYVRVTIENGDDPSLRALRVRAFDVARPVLVEGGHPRPYRLYYGSPKTGPPSYDFARLPVPTTAGTGTLEAEQANGSFRPPGDTRSFAAKHGWLVNGALALAACVVAAAGLVALRRR